MARKPSFEWRIADKEDIASNDGEGFLMVTRKDCCLYIYQQPQDFFWQVVDDNGLWEGQKPSLIAAMRKQRPAQKSGDKKRYQASCLIDLPPSPSQGGLQGGLYTRKLYIALL
jgi:hypothetical protein